MAYRDSYIKIIGVGFALLVQLRWAMREASECGTSNRYGSPCFFCIVTCSLNVYAEAGRSTGISNSSKDMENKKQNEELQSRREFFKKAAKGALPILGAIVLASNPLLSKASEESPMGCDYGCTYGCQGGCGRSCSYGCSGSCAGSCSGGCKGGCSRSCSISCSSGCRGYSSSYIADEDAN